METPGSFVIFGPREPGPVRLAEYDPTWPKRYDSERERIVAALGAKLLRIERVGSTSVPGLASKAIVDIVVDVGEVDFYDITVAMETAGYVLRVVETGHRMFRTADLGAHMHFWFERADFDRHVAFRDILRASAEKRRRYEAVKRELASRNWRTRDEYSQAKSAVISEIMAGR